MKILLTNDLGDAMLKREEEVVSNFISSIDKLCNMTKKQILSLDTVIDLSIANEKTKLYAYHISGKNYVIFSFTKKNEMLLIDYVKLHNGGVVSTTYPNSSTSNKFDQS